MSINRSTAAIPAPAACTATHTNVHIRIWVHHVFTQKYIHNVHTRALNYTQLHTITGAQTDTHTHPNSRSSF